MRNLFLGVFVLFFVVSCEESEDTVTVTDSDVDGMIQYEDGDSSFDDDVLETDDVVYRDDDGAVDENDRPDFGNDDATDDVDFNDSDLLDEESNDADSDEYPFEDTPVMLCDSYKEAQSGPTINSPELTEMSGFGVSRQNEGVIWTHNDSGGKPEVYAINRQGKYLGKIVLDGAENDDWEDIAVARCGNKECIYIADTGNNLKKRTNLRIYRIEEPKVDAVNPFGKIVVSHIETFPFVYPGNAKEDCEALAVADDTGTVYLFTKDIAAGFSKTKIYTFPVLTDGVQQTLIYVNTIQTGMNLTSKAPQYAVTAAAIDRSSKRLLLRMYSYLWEFRRPDNQPFEATFTQPHAALSPGNELQGESVDYDPYTGAIYHTSELYQGVTPVLYAIRCQ